MYSLVPLYILKLMAFQYIPFKKVFKGGTITSKMIPEMIIIGMGPNTSMAKPAIINPIELIIPLKIERREENLPSMLMGTIF